jgi:hypothetical protein
MTRSRRTSSNPTPQTITSNMPPDHLGLLVASGVLMLLGWGGLYSLITRNLPKIGGELWLFFVLLLVAVSATALPIVRYLNVRFTPMDTEVPPSGVIVRQSVWVGLCVVTCAWLQIPRTLTLPIAIFIVAVFVIVETFLRSREVASERE